MDSAYIYSQLNEIFRDVFLRDDLVLSANLTARDIDGWDSMKQIEIVIAIEESMRIKFSTRDLDSLHNVGDMVETIHRKISSTLHKNIS